MVIAFSLLVTSILLVRNLETTIIRLDDFSGSLDILAVVAILKKIREYIILLTVENSR